ncbi:unnamed protein product [Ceratitis capitata]|uniref:(Mediterranean fruit fly) hypothetical protein n=1 Tax=Ceratitis capitata TaxID=7213 RepID=A0A811V630_CERCA|nr:unnamed protein product [Ceratitis capitata]
MDNLGECLLKTAVWRWSSERANERRRVAAEGGECVELWHSLLSSVDCDADGVGDSNQAAAAAAAAAIAVAGAGAVADIIKLLNLYCPSARLTTLPRTLHSVKIYSPHTAYELLAFPSFLLS